MQIRAERFHRSASQAGFRRAYLFLPAPALVALLLVGLLFTALPLSAQRTRVPLDDGWRFIQGDPAGVDSSSLLYAVRPVARGEDQRAREAEATTEAAQVAASTRPVLKEWILPTANRFLSQEKQHLLPPGNPGGELPYAQANYDDSAWTPVRLPHDWAIAGPFGAAGVGGSMGRLPSPGVGWYRRKLRFPAADKGKTIALQIDGAMSYAAIWLNGRLVGGWPYGYASWQVDLTPYLLPGKDNQIAIRLDNPPDFSRWYPGAGLYRRVWLLSTAPLHVGQQGTYVTTPAVSKEAARVRLRSTIDNDSDRVATVDVATAIHEIDAGGTLQGAAVARMPVRHLSIAPGTHEDVEASVTVAHPRLWGPAPTQTPNRYVAVTTVSQGKSVVDRYETRFGIRKVEYRADGLFVNGERIRIQGVNLHHDLGALGAAFNESAAERQLNKLQQMGCNAIRMSHNPPAPELLELVDRRGMLVMDEIFDAWMRQKTPFDFHLIFADWHEADLRSFLRRDRNHPSVILWSVGNEVGEQGTGEAGAAIARELIGIAHQEDPTRPATASMNYAKPESPFAAAVDVISLNYQGEGVRDTPEYNGFKGLKTVPQYEAFHVRFPGKLILSSESAAALSSRDNYLFPVASGVSNPTRDASGGDSASRQVSAYELYAADFGSSADKVFSVHDHHPFVAGEFVWTGWDYLGEPTPYYSSRSSYFGAIDLAGFPKDRFYLYQSRWRPDLPMAHILPHWTWPERTGQVTPVHVFTSGDEAELFLNGRSLGRKKKERYEYRLRWNDVVYEAGVLKIVAYKNGRFWAEDQVRTAGEVTQLKLAADRDHLAANGSDLSFVTVAITDGSGTIAPLSSARVQFRVQGPGEIVGTDNGDATDMEALTRPDRRAFHGRCMAILRRKAGFSGLIRVIASSPGLPDTSVDLH